MSEQFPLHMLQMRLEMSGLIGLARRRRLPIRDVDLGYVTHLQLAELFGGNPPQPFLVWSMNGRWATLLAYSSRTPGELRETAETCADPAVYSAVDWQHFDSKPMPFVWQAGRRFGFEVRICPVVRMASTGRYHGKGDEVDAFLAACWKAGDRSIPVDREAVYRDWLTKRVEGAGARVLLAGLYQFKLERLIRRTQGEGRRSHLCDRPVAIFRGALEVTEPARFAFLIRRGVGRHRAFGFGMMLLRRAQ